MILVDTSIWIDFLRGENSLERRILHRLIEDEEEISINGIILTEILQGIKEDKKYQIAKKYLLEFPLSEPGGVDTYINAARIYRECLNKGKTIRSTIDCIIASICLENDLSILHKDRDFDIIQECTGLKVVKVKGQW
jgi:predicted nucleic acid-binding protein